METRTLLSRAEMERDKVGWCSCGRSGRQYHTRISATGEPELYVRSRWKCFAPAQMAHERVEYGRG